MSEIINISKRLHCVCKANCLPNQILQKMSTERPQLHRYFRRHEDGLTTCIENVFNSDRIIDPVKRFHSVCKTFCSLQTS